MLEKTKPEFVVALGHHAAMPAAFRFLVESGIPFLMEKPWGIDAKTVNELADLAESKKAWAAVPMPFRYSWFAETAVAMRQKGELGTISHGLMRFNQPGVQRYRDLGSPWMLSKAETGGGALINLGIHGFDLCRFLTGEEPAVVSAVTSHAIHKLEIEDYAHVTLRTPSGVVFLNEASYTFPGTGSDQERKISAEKAFLRATTTRRGRADQRSRPQRDGHGARRIPERVAQGRERVSGSSRPGRSAARDRPRLRARRVADFRRLQDGW